MSKLHPIHRTLYQWQTSTGATAEEFFSQDSAETWLAKKLLAGEHMSFYSRLCLVKVETTIVESVIRKPIIAD